MPTLLAVDISTTEAQFITAETSAPGRIQIVGAKRIPLEELRDLLDPTVSQQTSPEPSTEAARAQPQLNGSSHRIKPRRADIVGGEFDAAVALLPPKHVLFEYLSLPFSDDKRVEQVVPLQVQDLVPFDIDHFVVDSFVAGEQKDGQYEIVSSLVPETVVEESLRALTALGIDPKVLTVRSSALTSLRRLFPDQLRGSFGLLLLSDAGASLAFFVNNTLRQLREFQWDSGHEKVSSFLDRLFRDIRCSIARLEHDSETQVDCLYVLGNQNVANQVSRASGLRMLPLDLSSLVLADPQLEVDPNEIAWAIGLFANELAGRKGKSRLVDFRRGRFAYKPTWANFLAALSEQKEWIGLLLIWAVLWLGSVLYVNQRALSQIERAITDELRQFLPGEKVPDRREVVFLEGKITEIKDQLSGLGTLSSLSPLESLRQLSALVRPSVDVVIDTLTISHAGITCTGTVPDFPSVGKLGTALESRPEHFRNVHVDPKGKAPGSSRVKFSAEIAFRE